MLSDKISDIPGGVYSHPRNMCLFHPRNCMSGGESLLVLHTSPRAVRAGMNLAPTVGRHVFFFSAVVRSPPAKL